MKILRVGDIGNEKPAIIDSSGQIRDLSSIISDFTPETLNFNTIDKINSTPTSNMPILDSNNRKGSCVSKPSKFIGIGLNFKDHA